MAFVMDAVFVEEQGMKGQTERENRGGERLTGRGRSSFRIHSVSMGGVVDHQRRAAQSGLFASPGAVQV